MMRWESAWIDLAPDDGGQCESRRAAPVWVEAVTLTPATIELADGAENHFSHSRFQTEGGISGPVVPLVLR